MDLPALTEEPRQTARCCASLSLNLLRVLANALPPAPHLSLSIGSGSGLLEALLQFHHPTLNVEGVEVSPAVNSFLPEERIDIINGTWAKSPRALFASAFLWIYPRELKTVQRYLHEIGNSKCCILIWLGPRADWPDYEATFESLPDFKLLAIPDNAVAEYEHLAIFGRDAPIRRE